MATVLNVIPKTFFTKTKAGVLHLKDTRVSLDAIVEAFNEGAAAEEIIWRYPSLTLTQVYTAIAYYLHNKAEVDKYVEEGKEADLKLQNQLKERFPTAELRQRLLARYKNRRNNPLC